VDGPLVPILPESGAALLVGEVTPEAFLVPVGCVPVVPESSFVGATGVVSQGRFRHFDCRAADSLAVRVALLEHFEAVLAKRAVAGMATALAYGSWTLIDMEYSCSATFGQGGWTEQGTYELGEITVYPCGWIYTWQFNPEDPYGGGGGGGGSGGGGGDGGCCSGGVGGGTPPPPPPPPPPPDLPVFDVASGIDFQSGWSPPDCTQAQSEDGDRWWCSGTVPALKFELPRIQDAIQRMREIGGVCAALADTATAVLGRGALRLHTEGGTGFAGRDSAGSYMTIHKLFATNYYDSDHRALLKPSPVDVEATLQFVLAHETEHLIGGVHNGASPPLSYFNPNTELCSGLGPD
jgi:hypothetical protein